MTGDPRVFTSLEENGECQEKITFGDNSKGKVKGLGKIAILNDHSLSNVIYVASLSLLYSDASRPFNVKRTRPIASGAYCTPTGRPYSASDGLSHASGR
jgi:hypothetical protein